MLLPLPCVLSLLPILVHAQGLALYSDFECKTKIKDVPNILGTCNHQVDGVEWKSFSTDATIGLLAFYNVEVNGKTCQANSQDGIVASMNVGWIDQGCHSFNGDASPVVFKGVQFFPAADTLPVIPYAQTTAGVTFQQPSPTEKAEVSSKLTEDPATLQEETKSSPLVSETKSTTSDPQANATFSQPSTLPKFSGLTNQNISSGFVTVSRTSSSSSSLPSSNIIHDFIQSDTDSNAPLSDENQSEPSLSAADANNAGQSQNPPAERGLPTTTKTIIIGSCVGAAVLLILAIYFCIRCSSTNDNSRTPLWQSPHHSQQSFNNWRSSIEKDDSAMHSADFIPYQSPAEVTDYETYSRSVNQILKGRHSTTSSIPLSEYTKREKDHSTEDTQKTSSPQYLSTYWRGRSGASSVGSATKSPTSPSAFTQTSPAEGVCSKKRASGEKLAPLSSPFYRQDARTVWTAAMTTSDQRDRFLAESTILPVGTSFQDAKWKSHSRGSSNELRPRKQEEMATTIFHGQDSYETQTTWTSISERAAKKMAADNAAMNGRAHKKERLGDGLVIAESLFNRTIV